MSNRIKISKLHDRLYESYIDYSRRIKRDNPLGARLTNYKVKKKVYDKATVWCKDLDQNTISKSKVKDKLDNIKKSILNWVSISPRFGGDHGVRNNNWFNVFYNRCITHNVWYKKSNRYRIYV